MRFLATALSAALLLSLASAAQYSAPPATTHSAPGMKMPDLLGSAATRRTPSAQVSGLYVAAVPPVATESAAYMTLKNTGKTLLTLTGVSSPAARTGMLMTMTRSSLKVGGAGVNALDMTAMKMVDSFTLKPGQSLTFEPTGAHLMLSGLTQPLSKVGQTVPLTLSFKGGAVLKLMAPVKRF